MALKIKRLLVPAFVVAVVLPVTAVAVLSVEQVKDYTIEGLLRTFEGEVLQIENHLISEFEQVENDLALLKQAIIVSKSLGQLPRYFDEASGTLVEPGDNPTNQQLFEHLEQLMRVKSDFAYAYIGDSEGGYLQYPPEQVPAAYDPRQRPWYLAAMQTESNTVRTPAYYWAVADKAVISTVSKVNGSNNQSVGVIGLDLDLTALSEMLHELQWGQQGNLLILENSGNILVDLNRPQNRFRQVDKVYNSNLIVAKSPPSSSSFVKSAQLLNIDQQPHIQYRYYSADLDWTFVGILPMSTVNDAAASLTRWIGIIAIAALVFFVSLALFFSNTISNYIQRKQLDLEEASHQALQASKAKSDFLATMSHEIRTPMNGVTGMLKLLGQTRLDSTQTGYVSSATASADNLLHIINEILDFSKIEAGKLKIEHIDFNLTELVNDIITTFALVAERKRLSLNLELEAVEQHYIKSDPYRIRQILLNLISNAIKFTSHGSVTITVTSRASGDTLWLQFDVSDTGIGIAPEKLTHLFAPFTQSDSSTTREYGGTGLGLAISKRLCDLLDGNLKATSEPGHGSVFTASIPATASRSDKVTSAQLITQTGNAEPTAPAPPEYLTQYSHLKECRILVVEDNEVNRQLVSAILKQLNIRFLMAENGQQALQIISQASVTFDAILMDCQMPVMGGLEATKRLRNGDAGDANQHIPVIALTANAMQGDREACIAAGMNEYVAKPIRFEQLLEALAAVIQHPQSND